MGLVHDILNGNSKELRRCLELASVVIKKYSTLSKYNQSEIQEMLCNIKKAKYSRDTIPDNVIIQVCELVCLASERATGIVPYKVQITAGIVMFRGNIAEMKTGEGKTLAASFAATISYVMGDTVHIVTTNSYLAKRDSDNIGRIYKYLGLTCGYINEKMDPYTRQKIYKCDIVYGTCSEFGFDYLRDGLAKSVDHIVQRNRDFVIIDEADSILIDQARTPLIISGVSDRPSSEYSKAVKFIVENFEPMYKASVEFNRETENENSDVIIDEQHKLFFITDRGYSKIEKFYGIENIYVFDTCDIMHFINAAVRACFICERDKDYVINDDKAIIIDPNTGRLMYSHRYNNGLHQAIEAKEGITISNENVSLATISIQNYFKTYSHMCGMTGTAKTEESEFEDVYGLKVIEIPTNKKVARIDEPDEVYMTKREKSKAIIEHIKNCADTGQPCLVGTINVESSEALSKVLNSMGIQHRVLNAKNNELESEIIAQAGRVGAITVSTNMAGRGVDILLGGNPEQLALYAMYAEFVDNVRGIDKAYIADLINKYSVQYENDIRNNTSEIIDQISPDDKAILARYIDKHSEMIKMCESEKEVVKGLGGLMVLGTERHESRRIDNQLRGRSGRQGDPGISLFCVSLEDDLMRLFSGDEAKRILQGMQYPENTPIKNRFITRIVENSQKRVEANNYAARLRLLQFDNATNIQRLNLYKERNQILTATDILDYLEPFISKYNSNKNTDITLELFENYKKQVGDKKFNSICKTIILTELDSGWIEHVNNIEEVKRAIGIQTIGSRDPISDFQKEISELFNEMLMVVSTTAVENMIKYFDNFDTAGSQA